LAASKAVKAKQSVKQSAKPSFTATDVLNQSQGRGSWFSRNWFYIAAFFIPVILTTIAYAKFGIFPFSDASAFHSEKGSVLSLDLNGQYIYYFERIRDAFWNGGSVFYSWERNLSGEFMGIIGYYLASPFTLIPILLPRTMLLESILIMQLAKIGTAGLTFAIFMRKSKKLDEIPTIIFAVAYSMMAYAVIQLIDPMWIDGVVFLPLIILGIEYLVDDGRKLNYIIPLAVMFVANFYIGYMIAFFVAIYFFYYLFFGTNKRMKSNDYFNTVVRMGLSTVVVLMLAAILLLPVYNGLKLGKFDFSKPDYSLKPQFRIIELLPTLLPNQYYSVNMHGKPEIYCGVITLILLPMFYMNEKISFNKKLGYSFMTLLMFFSMYLKGMDMIWHGGQAPNWLPWRYSFLVSFILISMAATAFKDFDGIKITSGKVAGIFGALCGLLLYFNSLAENGKIAITQNSNPVTYEAYKTDRYRYVAGMPYKEGTRTGISVNWVWLCLVAAFMLLAAAFVIYTAKKDKSRHKGVKMGTGVALFCIALPELFQKLRVIAMSEAERSAYKTEELWLGTIGIGLLLAAVYLVGVYYYGTSKNRITRDAILVVMLFVLCGEVGYNAYDSFKKIHKEVAYVQRTDYYEQINNGRDLAKELKKYDSGLYRAEKSFFRTCNDALAYGLGGVSHSSSVMNTNAINFIETMGYSMRSYVTRYEGNSVLADSLLGIKYVVDRPSVSDSTDADGNEIKTYKPAALLNTDYEYKFDFNYTETNGQKKLLQVYENPDALSIGYMVSSDIKNLSFLGNDNPFNSQNMFMSTITGNTEFLHNEGTIQILGNKEYYTRVPETIVLRDSYEEAYGDQRIFKPIVNENGGYGDPTVNIHITAQSTDELYMYLKTQNEKAVNTWISSERKKVRKIDEFGDEMKELELDEQGNPILDLTPEGEPIYRTDKDGNIVENAFLYKYARDENNNYIYIYEEDEKGNPIYEQDSKGNYVFTNHKQLGTGSYYENHDYAMIRLGSYEPGTEIEVRLTIRTGNGDPYTIIKNFFIYHFHYDLFKEDIDKLKENQWNITEHNDRRIKGTITAKEGQMMLTSIPYEPGWSIYVDGKKVQPYTVNFTQKDASGRDVVQEVGVLKAFLGVDLEPGEHTVEMKFTPKGFNFGVFTLILGIGACVYMYRYDRKNNKVMLENARAKARGYVPETKPATGKKVSILKSSEAPVPKDETSAETATETAAEAVETAETKPQKAPASQQKKQYNSSKKKRKR